MRTALVCLVLTFLVARTQAQVPRTASWSLDTAKFKIKAAGLKATKMGEAGYSLDLAHDAEGKNWADIAYLSEESVYSDRILKVNDKPYTGTLWGFHPLFQYSFRIYFLQGKLHGNFVKEKASGMVVVKTYDRGALKAVHYDTPQKNDTLSFPEPVKKPIVYLYAPQALWVDLRLELPGGTAPALSYPPYEERRGWRVQVQPGGGLLDARGKFYYALYWEAPVAWQRLPAPTDEGFVVERERMEAFLEESLYALGLNAAEANEFMLYWLPVLRRAPYQRLHFLLDQACDAVAPLHVQPAPDSRLRLWLLHQPLQQAPSDIAAQNLPYKPFERRGFCLVEWGGCQWNFEE